MRYNIVPISILLSRDTYLSFQTHAFFFLFIILRQRECDLFMVMKPFSRTREIYLLPHPEKHDDFFQHL